ncbi:hypothetical protein AB0756_39700 [Tolypothrix campylonemoides VB511288_2]|uniref:Immunity protein 30 domain-containing protein n=1 Tax=Tolypothrix campylonemoides VB511288_2 TaxID=3232311 RepID=A0ABW8XPS9_9CYAN
MTHDKKITELVTLIDQIKTEFPDKPFVLAESFMNEFNRLNSFPRRETIYFDLKLIEKLGNLEDFSYEIILNVINSQEKSSDKAALDEIKNCNARYSDDYDFRRAVLLILKNTSSNYDEILTTTLQVLVTVAETCLGDLQLKLKQASDPFYRYFGV